MGTILALHMKVGSRVKRHVFRMITKHHEIGWRIICSDSVQMMNYLAKTNWTAKHFFRNYNMLKNVTFLVRTWVCCIKYFFVPFLNNEGLPLIKPHALKPAKFGNNSISKKSVFAVYTILFNVQAFSLYNVRWVKLLNIMSTAKAFTKMNNLAANDGTKASFFYFFALLFSSFAALPLTITRARAKRSDSIFARIMVSLKSALAPETINNVHVFT